MSNLNPKTRHRDSLALSPTGHPTGHGQLRLNHCGPSTSNVKLYFYLPPLPLLGTSSMFDVESAKSRFRIGIQCSMFHVRCSMFDVPCSMFHVRCSMFDVPRSMFHVRCSTFDVSHPDFGRWTLDFRPNPRPSAPIRSDLLFPVTYHHASRITHHGSRTANREPRTA